MPEGPSLVILREQLAHFAGQKIARASGSSKIELTRMQGLDLRSRTPPLPGIRDAIRRGVVRLCPICDAYEATGKRIAIYGRGGDDLEKHARFLRTFSPHVITVVEDGSGVESTHDEETDRMATMSSHTIAFDRRSCIITDRHRSVEVDVLYIALGVDAQTSLASMLGVDTDDSGGLEVDAHMQTQLSGLYAVGDVVTGLNQISTAVGQGATAATAIHNRLPPNCMQTI